jgi:hypothetical protein
MPEQAIEEAKLIKETIQGDEDGVTPEPRPYAAQPTAPAASVPQEPPTPPPAPKP